MHSKVCNEVIPWCVASVSEGHVAGAHFVEHPENTHIAVDGMARLNANQTGNLALAHGLHYPVRVCDVGHVVLVVGNQPLNDIILLHEQLNGVLVS